MSEDFWRGKRVSACRNLGLFRLGDENQDVGNKQSRRRKNEEEEEDELVTSKFGGDEQDFLYSTLGLRLQRCVVESVRKDSSAFSAGIQPGFCITQINGISVTEKNIVKKLTALYYTVPHAVIKLRYVTLAHGSTEDVLVMFGSKHAERISPNNKTRTKDLKNNSSRKKQQKANVKKMLRSSSSDSEIGSDSSRHYDYDNSNDSISPPRPHPNKGKATTKTGGKLLSNVSSRAREQLVALDRMLFRSREEYNSESESSSEEWVDRTVHNHSNSHNNNNNNNHSNNQLSHLTPHQLRNYLDYSPENGHSRQYLFQEEQEEHGKSIKASPIISKEEEEEEEQLRPKQPPVSPNAFEQLKRAHAVSQNEVANLQRSLQSSQNEATHLRSSLSAALESSSFANVMQQQQLSEMKSKEKELESLLLEMQLQHGELEHRLKESEERARLFSDTLIQENERYRTELQFTEEKRLEAQDQLEYLEKENCSLQTELLRTKTLLTCYEGEACIDSSSHLLGSLLHCQQHLNLAKHELEELDNNDDDNNTNNIPSHQLQQQNIALALSEIEQKQRKNLYQKINAERSKRVAAENALRSVLLGLTNAAEKFSSFKIGLNSALDDASLTLELVQVQHQEIEVLREERSETETILREAEHRLYREGDQIQSLQKALSEERKISAEYDDRRAQMERELMMMAQSSVLESDLVSNLRERIDSLETENDMLKQLRPSMDVLRMERAETEGHLRSQLAQAQAQASASQVCVQQLQELLSKRTEECDYLRTELAHLGKERRELESNQLHAMRSQLGELREQLIRSSGCLDELHNLQSQYIDVQSENASLHATVVELRSRIGYLEEQLQLSNSSLTEKSEQVHSLQKSIDGLGKKIDDNRTNDGSFLEAMKLELQIYQKQQDAATVVVAAAAHHHDTTQANAMIMELESTREQLQKSLTEVEVLRQLLNDSQQEQLILVQRAADEGSASRAVIVELETELKSAIHRIAALENDGENDNSLDVRRALEESLHDARQETRHLSEQLEKATEEIAALRERSNAQLSIEALAEWGQKMSDERDFSQRCLLQARRDMQQLRQQLWMARMTGVKEYLREATAITTFSTNNAATEAVLKSLTELENHLDQKFNMMESLTKSSSMIEKIPMLVKNILATRLERDKWLTVTKDTSAAAAAAIMSSSSSSPPPPPPSSSSSINAELNILIQLELDEIAVIQSVLQDMKSGIILPQNFLPKAYPQSYHLVSDHCALHHVVVPTTINQKSNNPPRRESSLDVSSSSVSTAASSPMTMKQFYQ